MFLNCILQLPLHDTVVTVNKTNRNIQYLKDKRVVFQSRTTARTDTVILTTLLPVFTIALEALEAEACDYGKGYISDTRLRF